jgi:hypothetical protein
LRLFIRSRRTPAHRDGPGLGHPVVRPGSCRANGGISHVPEQPHCTFALLYDPGWNGGVRPLRHTNAVPAATRARTPIDDSFGAQSHGFSARCLRFAGWVAPPPRKTRFRLPAKLCRVGFTDPLGCCERFPTVAFVTCLPPLSGFVAHGGQKWSGADFPECNIGSHARSTA